MEDYNISSKPGKIITKTVWILSLVSLFTDIASEMLYPVMPIYLKSIGFSIVLIGVLEGFAEAIAGLSKGYFGKLSDNSGKRLPFVQWGYLLSALSKPMMAIWAFPFWIFSARTVDRLGKGIRTGARDAMLSDETKLETKGAVFGFHRSMDTLGAAIGPLLALGFLYFYPGEYRMLFYFAFIPGIIAIGFTFFLTDKNPVPKANRINTSFFDFVSYWKKSPPQYRKLVLGLLLFTLFNSSDVFLLLKLKENGLSDMATIGTYIFYNVVYALFAYPLGIIADRLGLKNIFIGGLILFAIVYIGMAFNTNLYLFFALFFLYGVYAAATEGISKAWISNITDKRDTATAIGTFAGFQSICTMIASSVAGVLWFNFGSMATFITTAIITCVVVVYLSALKTAAA
ncbi:MAG: MFS transporter [Daejeonella sp.]|nr:MFS transporter [Daejeonella sp.]